MQYVKNQFNKYLVLKRVHLGATGTNLQEGETIDYDGFTLRHGGEDTPMHSLRGAVKEGWIAPVTDAGVTEDVSDPSLGRTVVHDADGNPIQMGVAHAENVDMGTLGEIRRPNAPATHIATDAGTQHSSQPRKKMAVVAESGSGPSVETEGVEIARFKNPSKMGQFEVTDHTANVIRDMESREGVSVEKTFQPPNPKPMKPMKTAAEDPSSTPATVQHSDPDEDAVTVSSQDEVLTQIRKFIPSFDWDVKAHWSQRVKAATEKYGEMPLVLDYILSVETESVRNQIQKRLAEAG